MGAECLIELLSRIDLEALSYELRHKANNETSKQRKTEALKRLQVVEALRESKENRENRTRMDDYEKSFLSFHPNYDHCAVGWWSFCHF